MLDSPLFFDVFALLLAAIIVVPIFRSFGIPPVLAYLAAGVALGPHTPGPVVDLAATQPLAELGVVFLLFAIGLEMPLSRLRTMRDLIFGLGSAQVMVSGAVIAGLALALGLSGPAGLVMGVTLAFSSTATILMLLVEKNEAVSRHGRIVVAVLIFQDLAVVPLLALLPLLGGDEGAIVPALILALAKALAAIALIYGAGRFLIRPLYRHVTAARTPEVFTATNLGLILAVGWLTAEAGMSMALGAFLAGMLLADSAYRHQVEADIEPFRGLLLGLFFMTVGMGINLPFVSQHWLPILGLSVGLVALKAALLFGLVLIFRQGLVNAIQVGLLLAQGGEFAFVILGQAVRHRILTLDQSQALQTVVALSMIATPLLAWAARILAARFQQLDLKDCQAEGAAPQQGHVLIAGYGRVGRAIAHILQSQNLPYLALDQDPDRVARARARGLPVFYGDASQPATLRAVGADRALAAVITVNNPRMAEKAVQRLRRAVPALPIIVRAHDLGQQEILSRAGATQVVPETIEASLQLAGLVLGAAGLDEDHIDHCLKSHRQDPRAVMAGREKEG